MPSFFIRNFGCRVNQAEAFSWVEIFLEKGLDLEKKAEESDVVLVNSCTLTERADRDVRKFIRRVCRENPRAGIVVTGCYTERARDEFHRFPQVRLILPNSEKNTLPERVLELVGASKRKKRAREGEVALALESSFRSRAHLKIQDGCDNSCTFCIIPSVRGKSASVDRRSVLACIKNLVAHGYGEIVLAGIHLSSYGEDLDRKESLLGLIEGIEEIEGLQRLRLSSLDPRKLDDHLLGHIAGNPKICQHFHLSLQHASGRILKRMGRAVGPARYHEILTFLRRRSPAASLGADVIVGFPGETDADFEILREFLETSPLTYFHVFSYSPRAGTPAARMSQVPSYIKKERSAALRTLSAEKNLHFRRSFLGKDLEAVVIRGEVERGGDNKKRWTELLTGNYIKVFAENCRAVERETVHVRISKILPRSTEGRLV